MDGIKFNIYGSCVSRDIFNFLNNELYCPETTINFNPIYSMFSEPIFVDLKTIYENIGDDVSNFNKKMTYYNFSKLAKEKILNSAGEWFVFDLGGERLPLQTWEMYGKSTNVPVTWDTYRLGINLREQNEIGDFKIKDWRMPNYKVAGWKELIQKFCKLILSKYDQSKIIYVSVQQNEEIIDANFSDIFTFTANKYDLLCGTENVSIREKQNTIIQDAEKIILSQIPNCWVIKMPEYTLSSVRHHFGSHPLHFDYLYYEYAAEAIKMIVKSRNQDVKDEKSRNILEKNLDFLRTIYTDKFIKLRALAHKANRVDIQFWGASTFKKVFELVPDLYLKDAVCDISVSTLFSSSAYLHNKRDRKADSTALRFIKDCNKIYKEILMYSNTEWIILDFLSEMKDTLCFLNYRGEKVEIMADYPEIYFKYLESSNCTEFNKGERDKDNRINEIKKFVYLIKEKWSEEHIIINEAYFCESFVNESGEIEKYNKSITNKNIELKEIYDLFYDMLPNCKRIRTCNRRISYIDDDPEYLSNDMTTYYSRALMAIMNNDEKLLNKLYKEQNIKAYIGGDKFS